MSREKLVELIEKAKVLRSLDILSGDPDVIVDMPTEDEYIADYLHENGVIVPPCKVGDKVYKLILTKDKRGSIYECKAVGFHMGDFPNIRGCIKRGQYLIVHHETVNMTSHINFKEIGKTVFFTREEAEAKLKERESK